MYATRNRRASARAREPPHEQTKRLLVHLDHTLRPPSLAHVGGFAEHKLTAEI
jgi:hypothetical protein